VSYVATLTVTASERWLDNDRSEPSMANNRSDPSGDAKQSAAALVELHNRLVYTIESYDSLLEVAEPEFAKIVEDFHALHIQQAQSVAAMLARDGHDLARGRSIFGRVNRAAVVLRAWFEDISTNVMEPLVEGEKQVL
jgi:maltooligosyltrehalose synthase